MLYLENIYQIRLSCDIEGDQRMQILACRIITAHKTLKHFKSSLAVVVVSAVVSGGSQGLQDEARGWSAKQSLMIS